MPRRDGDSDLVEEPLVAHAFSYEHMEIAAEERAMAERLAGHFDAAAEAWLRTV